MSQSNEPGRFSGRVAIVTGASHEPSIGRSTAERLAREGAAVVINARGEAALRSTEKELLDAGLVECDIGADDGRQRIYRLSARGRRVLARLRRSRARAIDAVWRPLGRRELAAFQRFAGELAGRLEDYARGR